MHVIAAKAVAFGEALEPGFRSYISAVVENAKMLAATLKERGADLVSGGTDTHLALVDLTPLGVTGKDADEALERAAITCNKNGIPNDPLPPVKTSGIRVGSPAGTTRGFGTGEFREIGHMVADVLDGLAAKGEEGDPAVEAAVAGNEWRRYALGSRSTKGKAMAFEKFRNEVNSDPQLGKEHGEMGGRWERC